MIGSGCKLLSSVTFSVTLKCKINLFIYEFLQVLPEGLAFEQHLPGHIATALRAPDFRSRKQPAPIGYQMFWHSYTTSGAFEAHPLP